MRGVQREGHSEARQGGIQRQDKRKIVNFKKSLKN